ncbi:MAG: efflux RND transporter periplasmic adaptor subunit [Candidatus Edwardsbacteria bacterium]|nr:efflux RND transporter periplasmic adaptor subunit [Candidatus Edwardsbacteria bacterium]
MKGKTILITIAAMITLFLGFKVIKSVTDKKTVTVQAQKYPVEILTVSPSDYDESINLSGSMMAENQTDVPSKVSGKIIKYLMEEGAWVDKGQNVVSIDRDEIGVEFKEAWLEAPISGWLTKKYLDTGGHVTPGMPLFQIADYHQVKLVVQIPEAEISRVKTGAGAQISIDAWPGQTFYGSVSQISPTVDYLSRTVKAEIAIKNPGMKIRPGMYARARINIKHHVKAVVIPTTAIIERETGTMVFVAEKGLAASRPIVVELDMGETCSIKSGLSFGDKLIVAGQHTVAQGSAVEIVGGK